MGRGQILKEKLKVMDPVATSQYSGDSRVKKGSSQKSGLPTREKMAKRKWREECEKKVVKDPSLHIGKNMLAIERHIDRYHQEVHAFQFFSPDHVPKACEVIAIPDWGLGVQPVVLSPHSRNPGLP